MSNSPRIDRLDRNYVINGAFDFWQRTTDSTDVNTASYKSDRFFLYTNGGSAGNIRQLEDAPAAEPILKYCTEFDLTTTTADGSNRTHRIIQRIESVFGRQMAGKTGSVSFWVKSTDFDTMQVELLTADVEDDFSASTQFYTTDVVFTDDGSWQKVVVTGISISSVAGRGIELRLFSKNPSGGGATNLRVTGIQFYLGDAEQEFSWAGRDYIEEEEFCQRFYIRFDTADGSTSKVWGAGRAGAGGSNHQVYCAFPVRMRAIPTTEVSGANFTSLDDSGTSAAASLSSSQNSVDSARIFMSSGTHTVGNGIVAYVSSTDFIAFNSEL